MAVSKEQLLQELPAYTDEWVKVKERQRVPDIIKLICERHHDFYTDYDIIGPYFIGADVETTCNNLYNFCAANLHYTEETEEVQTVGNAASILSRGDSGIDCKSYALFIGGCLDAIQRAGQQKIDWHYCFASYDALQQIPYHVFVVVDTHDGKPPMYVDPTPGAAGKEPFWVVEKWVHAKKSKRVGVLGNTVGTADTSNAGNGLLMPAPAWYPAYLPKFYNNGDGFRLRPLNAVPNYTANDVLDVCLYLQTLIGYNRVDWQNARSAAWKYSSGSGSAQMWVQSALKTDSHGDGSGNFAAISSNGQSIDGTFYSQLQQRYIVNESKSKPWLSAMQAKGGGIDLMSIPMGNDIEVPRPSWYASYLPSLFFSTGNPGQYPAGHLDTKPKIRNGASSGYTQYTLTPNDVAMYMVYAQPVIYSGATPYPLNWYINDNVNGAMASWFKITLGFLPEHTNSQMQEWGITGNIMNQPMLDANPFASGFTLTLETIVSAAISFFAGKIPGGTKLVTAAYAAGSIGGGAFITGGDVPPGEWSAEVFAAAQALVTQLAANEKNKKIIMFALLAALGLGWYYWDDIKKQI
jgi:hypothetical protein